jgi:hypothetical protein
MLARSLAALAARLRPAAAAAGAARGGVPSAPAPSTSGRASSWWGSLRGAATDAAAGDAAAAATRPGASNPLKAALRPVTGRNAFRRHWRRTLQIAADVARLKRERAVAAAGKRRAARLRWAAAARRVSGGVSAAQVVA